MYILWRSLFTLKILDPNLALDLNKPHAYTKPKFSIENKVTTAQYTYNIKHMKSIYTLTNNMAITHEI